MSDRQLPSQPVQRNKPKLCDESQHTSDQRTQSHQATKKHLLTPGSITVRPTRKDAEKSVSDFYTLVNILRRARVLPSGRIATAIGDNSPNYDSNISRKIGNRSFRPEERQKIARAIFEDEMTSSGRARAQLKQTPDAFYFCFLEFMGIQETSQDNARALAIGTYKFWRHSFDHDGEFVLGRVDIEEDAQSHALKVVMRQHKSARDGMPGADERFEGYFFRLADGYLMLMHDPENEDVRETHFTANRIDSVGVGNPNKPRSIFSGRRKHLIHLRGAVSGTNGKRGLSSPVEMVLVEDVDELRELDAQLDVIASGDPRLPPRVEAYLNLQGKMRRF